MQRKILVVDDNEINRQILRRMLCGEYSVIEAENGSQAISVLKADYENISAVLLDIIMPVMDGHDVLAQMRADANLSSIPVIVTTGNIEGGAEVKALSLGANDFIAKPYNLAVIKHRLWNTINLRETAAIANSARRDKLTGLWSREAFFEKAAEMIAAREPGYYVMACFDIDNFKVINDQYGTKKGDGVLQSIANIFLEGFEAIGGICSRIMADNFAVLYPERFRNSPELEELRRRVANPDSSIQPIAFSIGRYIVSDTTLSVSAMYDRATLAETSVKGHYDTYIAEYDVSMLDRLLHEQKIVTEMNGALEGGQFEVWFQPQYNHASGAMTGAEALVRWRRPENGQLIPPGEFIPVFERNGFVYELDKYVWEQTCIFIRRWLDSGNEQLPISVNVSRYDVFREDFYSSITGFVEKYEIPIDQLRLEVTETAFAKSSEQIISVVRQLVAYGFTVEIDDFGSGYSSLNTLKDVPASILKLDMKFLENTGGTQRGGIILESVVRMAKWLGMTVIAEGVETKAQADYLSSIGCFIMQGYYYARPMPADEFEALAADSCKGESSAPMETVDKQATTSGLVQMKVRADGVVVPVCVNGGFCRIMTREGDEAYKDSAMAGVQSGDVGVVQTVDEKNTDESILVYLETDVTANIIEKYGGAMLPAAFVALGNCREMVIEYIVKHFVAEDERDKAMEFFSREHILTMFSDGVRRLCEDWRIPRDSGIQRYFRSELQMVQDPYTGHVKVYTLLRDITEEKQAALELLRQIELDGMTGLYNKTAAESLIADSLAHDTGSRCALLIIDLDNLKTINDTLGHAQGDLAIRMIGEIIHAEFRQTDIVGRIGGDEFVVFISGYESRARLSGDVSSFMGKLSELRVGSRGELPLRGSIGIALGTAGIDSYDELFGQADQALYHVKRNGKNAFAFFTPEMEQIFYTYTGGREASIEQGALYLTMREADILIQELKRMFDIVRLVDAERMISYSPDVFAGLAEDEHHCYAVWNRYVRCENCTSRRALEEKTRVSKYECINGDIYLIISKYVEIDSRPYVMEAVSNVTKEITLGDMDKERVIEMITERNHLSGLAHNGKICP